MANQKNFEKAMKKNVCAGQKRIGQKHGKAEGTCRRKQSKKKKKRKTEL